MPKIKIVPKFGHKLLQNRKNHFKPSAVFTNNAKVLNQPELSDRPTVVQHNNRGKLKCSQCPRSFNFEVSLKKHELVHRSTNFPCATCGKTFMLKAYLKQHLRSHSDVRPYPCHVCSNGAAFKRKSELKKHLQLVHRIDIDTLEIPPKTENLGASNESPLLDIQNRCKDSLPNDGKKLVACKFCDRQLTSIRFLLNHMRKFHEYDGSLVDLEALHDDTSQVISNVSSPKKDPPSSTQRATDPILVNLFSIEGVRIRRNVRL